MNRIIDIKLAESNPTEPVTLTEVKTHLHITGSDNDTELTSLIKQCRKSIENYTKCSLVAKTVTMIAWLEQEWELPHGPVTGLLSVATIAGSEGSGPPTYETEIDGWGHDGTDFLHFLPFGDKRYKIIYTAGYSPVPDDLKLAVLNEIAFRYERKGDELDLETMSDTAMNLAMPYIRTAFL